MRKLGVDFGTVEVGPRELTAGEYTTLNVTYVAGKRGVAPGSGIKIVLKHPMLFQVHDPSGAGYAVAYAKSRGTEIQSRVTHLGGGRWFALELRVVGAALRRGDTITALFGDRNSGGPGIRLPNQIQTEDDPFIKVIYGLDVQFDQQIIESGQQWLTHPKVTGYVFLDNLLGAVSPVAIVGGPPARLALVVPSIVRKGETFKARLAVLDEYGNKAGRPATLKIHLEAENLKSPALIEIKRGDNNYKVIEGLSIAKAGVCRIQAVSSAFCATSNPIVVESGKPRHRIFWGDIHAQGALSDGTGFPDQHYRFAREASLLDISAITDHSDGLSMPMVESSQEKMDKWERIKSASRKYYEPGEFVTFPAFEWSEDNRTRDHRNVYFLDEDDSVLFNWRSADYDSPQKVWQAVQGHQALIIPHPHQNGTDWNNHNPALEPVVEIYSDKGCSEPYETTQPKIPSAGGVIKALSRGYRLGFVASGDYHHSVPGRDVPPLDSTWKCGFVAVRTTALDRRHVWDALYNRQCYATTAKRIVLDFSVNGRPMGSTAKQAGKRLVEGRVCGTADIDMIQIIKNGTTCFEQAGRGEPDLTFRFVDNRKDCECDCYYARIVQKDGNMAWSSPVWVGPSSSN